MRPARPHATRRRVIIRVLFLVLLVFGPVAAYAQPETPTAPTVDPASTLLVGPATPNPEPPLSERLEAGLNAVNGAVFATLFFDVAGGAFTDPVLGDDGQPTYEADPVFESVAGNTPVIAQRVDDAGQPLSPPEFITLPPGAKYQPVDAQGVPQTTRGDAITDGPTMPFLVVWLAVGAIFFTVYHGFINLRGMKHAIDVVRGKYHEPSGEGDISPFKALTSALSATVGLGNIAGVAVAMTVGGPGALFWMMFLGLFGMTAKFNETTLAQIYRKTNPDGSVSGGPMYFLDRGLAEISPALKPLGKVLAIVFAVFLMGAALGGGNMFQSNQSFEAFFSQFIAPHVAEADVDGVRASTSWGFGITMAVIVGLVVLGGIRRIGTATSVIVPLMAVIYVVACGVIIAFRADELPAMVGLIFRDAFGADAAAGGLIGAMMVGFQRAAFSSESGIGSSAVAHAAAKTSEPVREGLVASLEPFIDTIVICFMTGMVVLLTGAYQAEGLTGGGAAVTLHAFGKNDWLAGIGFPYILTVSIVLFAFSTMIAWCYYGERAWGYLFGIESVIVYRLIFVVFVVIGAVASLGPVIDSADAMLLSCALPNILGGVLLAPKVKRRLKDYWKRHKAGELERSA